MLLEPAQLIAFTLVTELGKTVSNGQHMQKYVLKNMLKDVCFPEGNEGFEERGDEEKLRELGLLSLD